MKKHKALNEKETIILLGYMYFSRETKQRFKSATKEIQPCWKNESGRPDRNCV